MGISPKVNEISWLEFEHKSSILLSSTLATMIRGHFRFFFCYGVDQLLELLGVWNHPFFAITPVFVRNPFIAQRDQQIILLEVLDIIVGKRRKNNTKTLI